LIQIYDPVLDPANPVWMCSNEEKGEFCNHNRMDEPFMADKARSHDEQESLQRQWRNTAMARAGLAADIFAGATAGFVVAPFVSILDKAITQNASGADTMTGSMRSVDRTTALDLLTQHILATHRKSCELEPINLVFLSNLRLVSQQLPSRILALALIASLSLGFTRVFVVAGPLARRSMAEFSPSFFRTSQFRYVWLVYGATYSIANAAATLCDLNDVPPAYYVLAASTTANTTTCIIKDRAFARMFGTVAPRGVPSATYLFWLARDVLSMACVFSLPPVVATKLDAMLGPGREHLHLNLSQFMVPMACQFPAAVLHLSGLDHYNNHGVSLSARFNFLRKAFAPTVAVRVLRGLVPYCAGAVANRELRLITRGLVGWVPKEQRGLVR